jgi:hypothetical protein
LGKWAKPCWKTKPRCDHSEQPGEELELTAKSERRYREIILQYRLHPLFPKVLYIVSGAAIQEKIAYEITNQKRIPGLPVPSTGKFYFVTLSALLVDPMAAPISNGSEDLSLSTLTGPMARTGETYDKPTN